jgi:hypothetical protein
MHTERSASYFQRCPAKRGFGPERKQLLQELFSAENMLTHFVIMTMGKNPEQKHLDARAEAEAEVKRISDRLSEICGQFKERHKEQA